MSRLVDSRTLTEDQCLAIANRLRVAVDFELPKLQYWQYDNCRKHRFGWDDEEGNRVTDRPKPGCQNCGLHFRKHQRIGISWLYYKKRALLADIMGSGKSQPLDSLVLTPDRGYVRMGDLQVGDMVVDPKGDETSHVVAIFPQGEKQTYRIIFNDHTWAESSIDHLWRVYNPYKKWSTKTLAEIKEKLNRYRPTAAVSVFPSLRYQSVKWILSIEPIREPEEHQCISVSASSGLYVTDNNTVTHNTAHAAGLIAILKETKELNPQARVLIVVRPAALGQWAKELNRMLPNIHTIVASGPRKQRMDLYTQQWDVCIIGPQVLINDESVFSNFPLCLMVTDDIDSLRNFENISAATIKRIGHLASRMVIMSGTPLQKRLHEFHSVLETIGGLDVFGSRSRFEKRYTVYEMVDQWNHSLGRNIKRKEVTGYRNIDEFRHKLAPMALRRTPDDIDDVSLPAIMPPNNVFLDMHPRQMTKYKELQQGVRKLLADKEGPSLGKATRSVHAGAQICGGLSLVGEQDGPGQSAKMDWVIEKLIGDLSEEKVVIFAFYKQMIKGLSARLDKERIGHVIISGDDNNKDNREASRNRFWTDPSCRVLLGTTAIEQSLNLQCARHIICVDSILNPSRMAQIVGRIRRDGSAFKSIYVHNLFMNGTQEERYLGLLEKDQALIGAVWDETSELYKALDPVKLMQLILS